ncbi:Sin3 associated polypeptide p18, partial [Usnea florida]
MAMQTGPGGKVDRQTTTPFHLKLFYRTGSFHSLADFPLAPPTPLPSTHPPQPPPLPPHLQIYTWPTCTLRELSHLLTTALPTLLPDPAIGTRISYRLLYPDTRTGSSGQGQGRYLSKELGDVIVGGGGGGEEGEGEGEREGAGVEKVIPAESVMGGALGGEPEKTLQEARFVI